MLSEGEKLAAQRLLATGRSYDAVGKIIGVKGEIVRAAIRQKCQPRGHYCLKHTEPLTPEKIAAARELRGHGLGWETIAKRMETTRHRLRVELEPDFLQRRRVHQVRAYRNKVGILQVNRADSPIQIPAEVLAERERVALAERSITALLMGDPPPGRSALDRRAAG